MERGLLDGTSSTLNSHGAFKIYEIGNWYTTNMSLSSAPSLVLAGAKAFDALPPQYKKLVMDSVKPSNDFWVKVLIEDDAKALELFKQKGLVAVTIPESELAKLRELVKPMYQEWIDDMNKRGHNGQELFDLMIKSAQAYKGA